MANLPDASQTTRMYTMFANVRLEVQDLGPIPHPELDGTDDCRDMFDGDNV